MILLLVIAILVLLAVMGSVYVLMAGADRQSTNASNGNANLAMAQASVLNIVRGQIGAQLTDGNGMYLGSPAPAGVSTAKIYARTWDMPQLGNTASITPTSPSAFYIDTGDNYRSEPWLVALPAWMSNSYFPPNTEMLWSGVDPTKMQTANAPLEVGSYATQTATANNITGAYTSVPSGFTAVTQPGVNYPVFSLLSPFLYDPTTGVNDIGMSYQLTGGTAVTTPGTAGTVYVPNASVVFPAWSNYLGAFNREGIDDSCWNLLPYSSPNGTRYRFAVRIMDENSMMNLNVGQAAVNPYNPGGQYFNGYGLAYNYDSGYYTVNALDATTAQMTALGKARSTGNTGLFANYYLPAAWQGALWTRDIGGTDSAAISLFGAASTLALQSYEGSIPATGMTVGAGPYYDSRAGGVLPNSLGYQYTSRYGQPWKLFFTAYSKDRPLRTEPDVGNPPFGLTASATFLVNGVNWQQWPASPGKIFVNAPADSPALMVGSATNTNTAGLDVPGGVALTAGQIAQAMGEAGFNSTQALAFAANYMTYRMGVANGGTNGPSFIDSTGPCVRGYNGTATNENFGSIGTFAAPANEVVAGAAAQPFIVQAAVYVTVSKKAVTYNNYAVVLYNPFGVQLALTNWILELYNGTGYSATTALNVSIPANGFLVVVQQTGNFTVSPSPTASLQRGTLIFAQSSAVQDVVLLRRILTRTGAAAEFPVDSFNIQPLMTGNSANFPSTGVYTVQRNCVPTTPAGDWYCDNASQTLTPGAWAAQLGVATGSSVTPAFGIPLYDRFTDTADCPGYYGSPGYSISGVSAAAGSPVLNIADFDNCPTLADFATVSGASYLPADMLASQVSLLTKNANEPTPNLQYEANARFDFFDDPAITVPDPAAIKLLDYITFDSAFSDGSVTDGTPTQNKLAVPGRINVNTASLPVLEAAIGSFDGSTGLTTSPQALATDIDDYRLRIAPFSSVPGMGLHSKAELTYALVRALNGVTPTTINGRDNATGFAELYNMATVRSDTFICYTYIQALRLNEEYIQNGGPLGTPGKYNVTDWYNATQGITLGSEGSIYNAQSVQNGTTTVYPEFILEGQKRFAALIDRTNATTNGAGANSANPADPQVVALQGLPQ